MYIWSQTIPKYLIDPVIIECTCFCFETEAHYAVTTVLKTCHVDQVSNMHIFAPECWCVYLCMSLSQTVCEGGSGEEWGKADRKCHGQRKM